MIFSSKKYDGHFYEGRPYRSYWQKPPTRLDTVKPIYRMNVSTISLKNKTKQQNLQLGNKQILFCLFLIGTTPPRKTFILFTLHIRTMFLLLAYPLTRHTNSNLRTEHSCRQWRVITVNAGKWQVIGTIWHCKAYLMCQSGSTAVNGSTAVQFAYVTPIYLWIQLFLPSGVDGENLDIETIRKTKGRKQKQHRAHIYPTISII